MHWVDLHERRCPLLTIEDRFPKLAFNGQGVARQMNRVITLPGSPPPHRGTRPWVYRAGAVSGTRLERTVVPDRR